jgi:hypothetical protein
LASLALAGFALPGCTTDNFVTAPESVRTGFQPEVKSVPSSEGTWTEVASARIKPTQGGTVSGSRYTLQIAPGALHNAMDITISERHPGLVDVQFEPDGTVFKAGVTLTIDYTNTPSDPNSPYFTGSTPTLGRWDTNLRAWTEIRGVNDPVAKTYTVQLGGFSRYAITERAPDTTDFKHPAPPNQMQ